MVKTESSEAILVGYSENRTPQSITLPMITRHGIIAGATGTGKTVTLQTFVEECSCRGIPVFLTDVKGDLTGLAAPAGHNKKVEERLLQLKVEEREPAHNPVALWDVFGVDGIPLRTTVTELGPLVLARSLSLSEVQSDALQVVFRLADDQELLLIDLSDLRAVLEYLQSDKKELASKYGAIASQSLSAIVRSITAFEAEGGERFFGEPAFSVTDLLEASPNGQGIINILSAAKLYLSPTLYSSVLLWLLSDLFESLPEVGDVEIPRLVLVFDEAHLLFRDTPVELVRAVERIVRLIRSKGVGVFLVTQNPLDIPEVVLSQLGNKIQHALRAFSPREQKTVKGVAQSFRTSSGRSLEEELTELEVGEAVVSLLDAKGTPSIAERTIIVPPRSFIGALSRTECDGLMQRSPQMRRYRDVVDRESAREQLAERAVQEPQTSKGRNQKEYDVTDTVFSVFRSAARSLGGQIGREIARGVMGTVFRTGKRSR